MMILISTRELRETKPVCVTEKDSETHKKYLALNEQAIVDEIESYRQPFDDHGFMYFNMGRDIAEDYRGDFESFFRFASGTSCARDTFFKEGVDAMKKLYPNQCILDYWRACAVYNLFKKDPRYADGSGTREDYIAFDKTVSDREALESMLILRGPYTFTEVEAA